MHIFPQTKHQWQILSIDMSSLEIQEIGWDLSLMKISYNLTKRTKTENFEKNFNMFIANFKTVPINWLLRVTSFIQCSIRSLWELSAIYGYLKNKNNKFKKKLCKKSVKGIKKMNFSLKTILFNLNFKSNGFSFIYQYNFKKSTNINKYIRTTKFSRKHVFSTQLISSALIASQ